MAVAVKPALKKIEELEKELKKIFPENYVSEFVKVKQANLKFFDNGVAIDKFVKREKFNDFFFEKLSRTGLEADFDDKPERIDRAIDLVFFFSAFLKYEKFSLEEKNSLRDKILRLKAELIKSIWWYGERGRLEDLDLLNEKKTKADEEIKIVCRQSQQKIIERCLKELLEFFELNPAEFLKSVKNTIAECESVEYPDFKKLFDAKNPSRVIEVYKEIKDILKNSYNSEDVKEWLNAPNRIFEGYTPRESLIKGKTFQVLYFLRKLQWG